MKLGIYCCGGFGREVLNLAQQVNKFYSNWKEIVFIDDNSLEQSVSGIEIKSLKEILDDQKDIELVIAHGEPLTKKRIYQKLKKLGFSFTNLIHPMVNINSNIIMGESVIICEGSILTVDITLGNCVIININSTIGHDSTIDDYSTISPSCNISGGVQIEDAVYIGSGTNVRDGISIGTEAIIGIGSLVIKDIPSHTMAYGAPIGTIKAIGNSTHIFK